jgi:transposase InsO family protein
LHGEHPDKQHTRDKRGRRKEERLDAVEHAVLELLAQGSRETNLALTTDNGTQFTSSRFLETLGRLGITHRRTGVPSPGRQQLHRTLPSQLEGRGSN